MTRPTLRELRRLVLFCMSDGEWWTPQGVMDEVKLAGHYWYRVALVMERLAGDGVVEMRRKPGSGRGRYRMRRAAI